MIAQRIAGIRVDEHIERAVVQRKPCNDRRELRGFERKLIRPHRMRADRTLMEAAHLQRAGKTRLDGFAREYPDIKIEIDVENGLIDIVERGFDAGVRLASRSPGT